MTPFDPTATTVLVLDLESTHLDERLPGAALLEFGAVLCDGTPALVPLAEASLTLRPPGAQLEHDRLWASMDGFTRDMHVASGLWEESVHNQNAWDPYRADPAIVGWINGVVGSATAPVVLAGSGVSHFDDRWLRAQLPLVFGRLSYWSLDAGVIRRALQYAGRDDLIDLAGDVEAKPHRALADARLHAAELRRYLGLLAALGAPDAARAPDGGPTVPQAAPEGHSGASGEQGAGEVALPRP